MLILKYRTWGHHDLVLLRSYSQKGQIILRVDVAHDTSRLGGQLLQQAGILSGGRVVQWGLYWYAFMVDDYEADHAFVRCYSFDCFLNFGLNNEWKIFRSMFLNSLTVKLDLSNQKRGGGMAILVPLFY